MVASRLPAGPPAARPAKQRATSPAAELHISATTRRTRSADARDPTSPIGSPHRPASSPYPHRSG